MKILLSKSVLLTVVFCISAITAEKQSLVIASAAGYKKPVSEIMTTFQNNLGVQIRGIFGNLQMVTNQAKQSGDVSVIIGDLKFLKKLSKTVTFTKYINLGKGILVIAYRKGITISRPEDIVSKSVQSVFMPQDGKAIYGIAAKETLQSYGLNTSAAGKLTQVGTVPQVVSYLLTGEADAGFINLTEAMANQSTLGGYITVPKEKYKRIDIVAGVVEDFDSSIIAMKFVEFLQSDTAKTIFTKFGL